jgi:galactitol PTS system EIIB component
LINRLFSYPNNIKEVSIIMVKPKVILVACGTAVATSTVVAVAIEEACKKAGLNVTTRQCKASEVPSMASSADLIVTTTPVREDLGIPVIQGLAFLTGIGKDDVLKQIVQLLQN